MAHLQYMPGDPRLVDQLVCELKSKGIFDQFRKDCIADVDTRPAYQNLRQRVESSVCAFLSRQCWKPDLNKNQLREKLRKHILDGNYLEQGVERIVDQVVNPKVTSVFIPQVEDLVYNYLGIPRKKIPKPEEPSIDETIKDLLPTDLEAVSPGSVKSNDEKMEVDNKVEDMEIDSQGKTETPETIEEKNAELIEVSSDSASLDKSSIPLPAKEIDLNDIPAPDNSPKEPKVEVQNIELPREPNLSTDIPLPDEVRKESNDYIKPMVLHSEDSNSSSSSSIRRNMSPLTPVRNFDDENSCDAQQAFENDSDEKANDEKPSTFQFKIDIKDAKSNNSDAVKNDKKEEQILAYQFTNRVNINTSNTPLYDDSSNSHNLQIDYESDASKTNQEVKPEVEKENTEDKKEKKDDKKTHKSSHRSRDSSRHSSSKDGRHSSSRDHSRHDKKSSSSHKDDKSKSNKEREKLKESSEKKDKDSSHRSSHKSSSKDKSHRSSSSSHRHSNKSSDEKKSSHKDKSSEKDKDRSSDKSSRDRKDSKSSHRDKDRKSSSKKDDKDKKKEKKDTDDHYSSSGRGNRSRRSTDRDSNDGSNSSSKGSHNQSNSKSADNKKESKSSSSKSETTSNSGESTSPSDKEHVNDKVMQFKPIVRVDNHLEMPIANPPRLPFVPDVTLKKPKYAANFEEAKKMMKMRRFLAEEQKRMNQEAALLLEFQANVRPSLSQVYSSIPGPELEFACVTHTDVKAQENENEIAKVEDKADRVVMDVCEEKTEESMNVEKIHDSLEQNLARIVQTEDEEPKLTSEIDNEVQEPKQTIFEMTNEEPKITLELNEKVPKLMTFELTSDLQVPKQMTLEMINEVIGVAVNEEMNEQKTDIIETVVEEDIPKIDEVQHEHEVKDTEETNLVDEIGKFIKATDKSTDSIELCMVEDEMSKIHAEFETVPSEVVEDKEIIPKIELQYFAEHEKFNAELERHKFSIFFKEYVEKSKESNKMYLINCDTYEESIVRDVASNFGDFEIVNYYKNGHLHTKNIVKDVSLAAEVSLPIESSSNNDRSPLFSPVKSECSFELSSDYDAKLDEIVHKKSRQEVMEIILGGMIDESSTKMPTIDYYTDDTDTKILGTESSEIVSDKTVNLETIVSEETVNLETIVSDELEESVDEEVTDSLKRKADEVVNKRSVLTPNKIRKMSDSDQISSTTEETEVVSNNNKVQPATRSKYLGRAKRIGLPRPKRCALPNSPSSDKSVENYAQNTPTPNGKMKTPRSKVQRYDTSDLYKPKLHYLSRRNMS